MPREAAGSSNDRSIVHYQLIRGASQDEAPFSNEVAVFLDAAQYVAAIEPLSGPKRRALRC